jgi:hypothetical protein
MAALLATIHGEQGEAIEIPPDVAAAGAKVGDVVAREGMETGVEVVVQGEQGEGEEVSWMMDCCCGGCRWACVMLIPSYFI